MNSKRPESPARRSTAPVAPNVNALWSRIIVDELARCGVEHVVISPGSRSAPLVFQFAEHPNITDHSVVDERSAAFFALGLARASGTPVALLCTSGTAAANYFPAICEAGRDRIPLLVLTGTRPAEDQDCGVQQVMDQTRLYGAQVRAFHSLPQPEISSEKLAALRSRIARAWHESRFPQAGPVHLDIPFRKPLEPVEVRPEHPDHVAATLDREILDIVRGRARGLPWLQIADPVDEPDSDNIELLVGQINQSHRTLIVAGAAGLSSSWRNELRQFAENACIPVLAAPQSGLRHWGERGAHVMATGDLLAGGNFYPRHGLPDLVLHLGSAPLTWPLQELMRQTRAAPHIVISDSAQLDDPEHRASHQFIGDPGRLFRAMIDRIGAPPAERRRWQAAHLRAEQQSLAALDQVLTEQRELTAPDLWRRIGQALPQGSALFTSSSMVVRDLDCFMAAAAQDLEVHFNRGLNGIDGAVATALGVAAARRALGVEKPTLLVIGDVALRHDLGSLPLAAELGLDLAVVVIDNAGGEIFDYLPGAAFPETHRRHFTTASCHGASGLLPAAVGHTTPGSPAEFSRNLTDALHASGLNVIIARTSRPHDQQLRTEIAAKMLRIHAGSHLSRT